MPASGEDFRFVELGGEERGAAALLDVAARPPH